MTGTSCGCGNLNEREVTKRRVLGGGSFLVSFALIGVTRNQTPRWVQWMPAVGLFFGYLNLLQAHNRTCVGLALTDRDMLDGKLGPVLDRETGWKLKKRAFKMILGAGLLTAVSCGFYRTRPRS